jgi:pentatricopeptide repeat protein
MMEAVQRIANQCIMAGIKTDTTLFTLLLTLKSTATPPRRTRSSSTSGTTTASPPIQIEGNTDLAFVLQSHREMLAKCVEPNVYTYTALINLFGKHGYVDTAQQIFDLMQQSDHHRPTTVTYCAMIEVLRLANQQDQVDFLLYDFLVQSKSDRSQGKRLWVDAKLKHQFRCYHGC